MTSISSGKVVQQVVVDQTQPENGPSPIAPAATGVVDRDDLALGLSKRPLNLPSKYFYDDRGSALFEAICELPEYYLTRTERRLLDEAAGTIAEITGAREVVELGAGSASKTHHLLEALMGYENRLHYVALDISQYALEIAAESLSAKFPGLRITGIQCDFTQTMGDLEPSQECLAIFLGSTIGNFSHEKGVALLRRVRERLSEDDWLLIGLDLVKPVDVQEAAYNDTAGVTAEFNKNILNVVNRETDGDFDPDDFLHLAFFNEKESQIEMHLVAKADIQVRLESLGMELEVQAGERIRTEISRKFTRESAGGLLTQAGFEIEHWFESENGYFGLVLASATG